MQKKFFTIFVITLLISGLTTSCLVKESVRSSTADIDELEPVLDYSNEERTNDRAILVEMLRKTVEKALQSIGFNNIEKILGVNDDTFSPESLKTGLTSEIGVVDIQYFFRSPLRRFYDNQGKLSKSELSSLKDTADKYTYVWKLPEKKIRHEVNLTLVYLSDPPEIVLELNSLKLNIFNKKILYNRTVTIKCVRESILAYTSTILKRTSSGEFIKSYIDPQVVCSLPNYTYSKLLEMGYTITSN
ncbi:MAG: hypothetical protein R3B45_13005 [Bdellovibrionota bacterium]